MEGLFLRKEEYLTPSMNVTDTVIELISKFDDFEIMRQTLYPHSIAWICPAEDPGAIEFFYIVDGEIIITANNIEHTISKNESFYVSRLKQDISIRAKVESKILYITNRPFFDDAYSYQGDLIELLKKVDEKDNYTFEHGKNVMEYAVAIMKKFTSDHIDIENITMAALFHDVGKCFIPDEVLKKNSSLTAIEFRHIIKHPINSKRLLEKKFGKKIGEIALCHHERMNGSGYPYGIKEDEIPFESRIIAVADSFDAMTTKRTYNMPKTFDEAISELKELGHIYDINVVNALAEVIKDRLNMGR